MFHIILFSGIAGIIGTGLGGLVGIFLGERTTRTVSLVLTFASGVMVSIALFDLMPEAYEASNSWVTAGGVLLGVFVISGFNRWIDQVTQKVHHKIKTHATLLSLHHQEDLVIHKPNAKSMLGAGIIMLIAIALHNIPEGMAIGATDAVSMNLSITLAVLLTLHNIPEGIAIAVPLAAGGIKKLKIIFLILLAGSTTIIGGTLGALIGGMGSIAMALSLSFAAGAMLYVTFCEIIPQSVLMEQGRLPAFFSIFGILVGFILTTILH